MDIAYRWLAGGFYWFIKFSHFQILSAKPSELNKWVSVKKMSQYRTQEEELYDKRKFQKMAKKGVKFNVIPSLKEG